MGTPKNSKLIGGLRHYEIGGEWYPSVTSILSGPKSIGYSSGSSGGARQRGTTIHEFCERRLHGRRAAARIPDDLRPYWESLQPSLRQISGRKRSELFVWHRELRYAGTLDALATFRGVRDVLIDFKTTADIGSIDRWLGSYRLQLAAYAGALHDCHGIQAQQVALIVAHPAGPAREMVYSQAELDLWWPAWCDRVAKFHEAIAARTQQREAERSAFAW